MEYCHPGNAFLEYLSSTFNICIPSALGLISTIFGLLSITSWLFAQLPQIIRNFRVHSTSGLSIYFLGEWLLGDASNLIGGIYTKQATWQVALASYYCLVDCMLVGQWIYYEHLRNGRVVRRLKWWRFSERGERTERRRQKKQKQQQDSSGSSGFNRDNTFLQPGSSSPTPISAQTRKSLLDESIPPGGNSPRYSTSPLRMPPFSFSNSSRPVTPTNYKAPIIPQNSAQQNEHDPLSNQDSASVSSTTSSPRTILRPPLKSSTSPVPSPRTVLYLSLLCALFSQTAVASATDHKFDRRAIINLDIGTIFSWSSTFLYLISRLPQLIHNFTRRSTAGLSPALFIAAFLGNLFYSSSLLTNPFFWEDMPAHGGGGWNGNNPSNRSEWTIRSAPFFLGAAGVLLMDAGIGVQFMMWGEKRVDGEEYLVVEEPGESGPERWRKVSGWMRGWMPRSVVRKPKIVVGGEAETDTEAEDTDTESLLSRGDGSNYGTF